jgi:hypothetical protein
MSALQRLGVFDSWLGMLRALQGRADKAQANGLGTTSFSGSKPCKGEINRRWPLRNFASTASNGSSRPSGAGKLRGMNFSPRPLAWALLDRSVGAEEYRQHASGARDTPSNRRDLHHESLGSGD